MEKYINDKYVYSELSSRIIGAAFEVQNGAGVGRPEKTYQKLMATEFKIRQLKYKEQVIARIEYKGANIGKRIFDFVVEEKVVVELKVGNRFARSDFEQIYEYLRMSGLQLGLLILFTSSGVKIKRIPNLK